MTQREIELYTGNCPPERPCRPQDVSAYRAHIDGTPVPKCIHFGAYTGEKRQCPGCNNKTFLKIFACELHQICVLETPLEGVKCCGNCPDYKSPPIESGPISR